MNYITLVLFAFGSPTIYLHMISQRKKFYQKRAESISAKTDIENDDEYVSVNWLDQLRSNKSLEAMRNMKELALTMIAAQYEPQLKRNFCERTWYNS